jgi:hypothetical protein
MSKQLSIFMLLIFACTSFGMEQNNNNDVALSKKPIEDLASKELVLFLSIPKEIILSIFEMVSAEDVKMLGLFAGIFAFW